MRARNRGEEIGVAQDERRLGENADDAGVRLTRERLENAARESILLLGTLIGVRDRTEQDRGRASCPPQPGQLYLEQRDRVDLGVEVVSPVADRLTDEAPGKACITVVAAKHTPRIRVHNILGVRKLGPHEDGLRFGLNDFHRSGWSTRHAAYDGGTVDESLRCETLEPLADAHEKLRASARVQRFQLAFRTPKRKVHPGKLVELPVMLKALDPYLHGLKASRGK